MNLYYQVEVQIKCFRLNIYVWIEELKCYFLFVFECDKDGEMVGFQSFKCLPNEVG